MKKKLIILFLIIWGCMSAFAQNYGQTAPWGTPPSYQFQSTSTCATTVGNSTMTSTVSDPFSVTPSGSGPRRAWGKPDDGDSGIGELPDPAPVGEPLVLLLFAAGYILFRLIRKRTAHDTHRPCE